MAAAKGVGREALHIALSSPMAHWVRVGSCLRKGPRPVRLSSKPARAFASGQGASCSPAEQLLSAALRDLAQVGVTLFCYAAAWKSHSFSCLGTGAVWLRSLSVTVGWPLSAALETLARDTLQGEWFRRSLAVFFCGCNASLASSPAPGIAAGGSCVESGALSYR